MGAVAEKLVSSCPGTLLHPHQASAFVPDRFVVSRDFTPTMFWIDANERHVHTGPTACPYRTIPVRDKAWELINGNIATIANGNYIYRGAGGSNPGWRHGFSIGISHFPCSLRC